MKKTMVILGSCLFLLLASGQVLASQEIASPPVAQQQPVLSPAPAVPAPTMTSPPPGQPVEPAPLPVMPTSPQPPEVSPEAANPATAMDRLDGMRVAQVSGQCTADETPLEAGMLVDRDALLACGQDGRLVLAGAHRRLVLGPGSEARLSDGITLYQGLAVLSNRSPDTAVDTGDGGVAALDGEVYLHAGHQGNGLCLAPGSRFTLGAYTLDTRETPRCFVLHDGWPGFLENPDTALFATLRGALAPAAASPFPRPDMMDRWMTARDQVADTSASGTVQDSQSEGGDSGTEGGGSGGESLCLDGGDNGSSGDIGDDQGETELERGQSRVNIHILFKD